MQIFLSELTWSLAFMDFRKEHCRLRLKRNASFELAASRHEPPHSEPGSNQDLARRLIRAGLGNTHQPPGGKVRGVRFLPGKGLRGAQCTSPASEALAKKAVGKAKPRPELPVALPGDQLSWTKDKPLAVPVKNRVRRKSDGAILTRKIISSRHPMVIGVEEHFRKSRKVEDGEFLRPYKQLLPDIVASEACLARALDLADEIYGALARKSYRVLFAPSDDPRMRRVHIEEREAPGKDRKYGRYSTGSIWSPHRPTITYLESVPIGLALTEMTERATMRYAGGKYVREDSKVKSARSSRLANSWTTERDLPCGRFRLVVYSPISGVDWVASWQETTKSSISAIIPAFVRKLEDSKDDLRVLMLAAEEAAVQRQKEWAEAQGRYRRQEDQRCVDQASAESQKQLLGIMDRWAAAMSVERFFREAEKRMESVESMRRAQLAERLALARAMLVMRDPLDYLEERLAPEERYKSKYS
jgi:hypothetical protein